MSSGSGDATNDKGQQLRHVSLYLLPVVVGNLVPLVTLPVFTRLLSTADFGAWALANAYAVVVGGVASVGLPISYDRNFFAYPEPAQRSGLLYGVLGFSLASLTLLGGLTWAFRGPITAWLIGDRGYEQVLVWSFGATAVALLKNFYLAYLRNSEQAGLFSMYTIGERLLSAALTLLLVVWAGAGVVGLVAGQLFATLIVLVIVAARLARSLPVSLDGHLLADSLKLGVPLLPRILFGVIGNNFDKYLIGQLTSLGGVGIYSVGQRVANIAFVYMTALQNVFGPQVYARMFSEEPAVRESIGRYLTPFAYVSTVVGFLIALFSEEILVILAPASYRGAIPIVAILALYYTVQFFGKMPQIAYSRKTYLISILAAMSTVLSVGLGAAGIWMWGTIGAAWGALAAGVAVTTMTFVVGQRCFWIAWERRRLVVIFGLLFGSVLSVIALREAGVPYGAVLLVKLGSLASFAWVGGRLGILTRENLLLVRALLFRRPAAAGVG